MNKVQELENFLHTEHPDVKVKNKDDENIYWLHRIILYLGKVFVKGFMTNYATTIGKTIYLPVGHEFNLSRARTYILIRHELVHVIDYKRFGLWFVLSYALLFPAILTMRSFWEIRGYTQTIMATYDILGSQRWGHHKKKCLDGVCEQFLSSAYFWMLPFEGYVRRKFESIANEIESGGLTGFYPYTP